jgi:hypothetical protein
MSDIYWGPKGQTRLVGETLNDAVFEFIEAETCGEPDSITIGQIPPTTFVEWAQLQPSPEHQAENALENLLINLDEEYGDPDDHWTEPTENMKKAALTFAKEVLKEYVPWACEPTGKEVVIDVLAWSKENRPEWVGGEPNKGIQEGQDAG